MLDEQELRSRIKRFLDRKSRRFPNLDYEFTSRYMVDVDFDEEENEYDSL